MCSCKRLAAQWELNFLFQETMEDIDKDGDGKINLEEYIGKIDVDT